MRERLRDHGEARAELEAARAWGVSRKRFLGWEPRTTTEHAYDEDGRLLRSVTTTEPEWDDTERAYAITLLDLEADLCNGCGQPLSETTLREAFDGYDVPDPHACQGCKALIAQQKEYAASESMPAYRFRVVRAWTHPDHPGGPHGH
jgi:hypothetical protein